MRQSVNGTAAASQAPSGDYERTVRTQQWDHAELAALRLALKDKGWETGESLSAHMGGKDRRYIERVLSGEKPMPAGFLDDLPHAAVGLYHARQAEKHGHYVVSPAETVEDGARALIVGVLSAFAAFRLPTKAQQMARASVPNNNQTKKVG
jgi:hypothetical protein